MPGRAFLAILAALGAGLASSPAGAVDFVVSTAADGADLNPGDGTCATSGGSCSLRAAVIEANALLGGDRVLLGAVVYRLTLVGAGESAGDLDIASNLEILGQPGTVLAGVAGIDGLVDVTEGSVVLSNLLLVDYPVTRGGCVRSTGALIQSKVRCEISPNVFADGFESGGTGAWSSTAP